MNPGPKLLTKCLLLLFLGLKFYINIYKIFSLGLHLYVGHKAKRTTNEQIKQTKNQNHRYRHKYQR